MIGMQLIGGLCNMLFQIATAETWRSEGHDVVYTNMDENLDYIQKNYSPIRFANEYKKMFENFGWGTHKAPKDVVFKQKHIPFVYTKFVPQDGYEYIGYFQSEKNFPDKRFIGWLFLPSEQVKEHLFYYDEYFKDRTCSIHVRRSDYVGLQDHHPALGMDYYNAAMWTLDLFKIDRFIVFSDDIDWCKKNFIGDNFAFIDVADYLSLFLMSKCTHHIIANSSFSWWGSYLAEKFETITIAPKVWFGQSLPEDHAKDIIPSRWIRL